MKRRALLPTLMAVTLLPPFVTWAAAQQMTASEIEDVLTGNTIEGSFNSISYRQYFAEDGTTIYVPKEGKPAQGRWRVDPETDVYESWWVSTGWIPFAMIDMPEDDYAWVNGDQIEPFEVTEGKNIRLE